MYIDYMYMYTGHVLHKRFLMFNKPVSTFLLNKGLEYHLKLCELLLHPSFHLNKSGKTQQLGD